MWWQAADGQESPLASPVMMEETAQAAQVMIHPRSPIAATQLESTDSESVTTTEVITEGRCSPTLPDSETDVEVASRLSAGSGKEEEVCSETQMESATDVDNDEAFSRMDDQAFSRMDDQAFSRSQPDVKSEAVPERERWQADATDVKCGSCWYDWPFLQGEALALKAQLEEMAEEEYARWAKEYDCTQDRLDEVQLRGMCRPGPAFHLPGSNPLAYTERAQRYVLWRAGIRQLHKAEKQRELETRMLEAFLWWSSRGGASNGGRRLEMGLYGLHPDGAGCGLGGGPV